MNYQKLSQKPTLFARYTSLSVAEFNKLAKKLEPLWIEAERERLSWSNRKRKLGGGRKYKLKRFEDKLLLILAFYKLYLTFDLLGFLFQDLNKSCISRLITKLEPVLSKKMKLVKIKRKRPISSLDELISLYPEIVGFIGDATEQEIPRPKDKKKRKKFYSGKKKRHTIKTQLFIERKTGQILEVSSLFPGSIHDYKVFQLTKVGKRLPRDKLIYLDKGYQGVKKDYPSLNLFIPRKGNRWYKLSLEDKIYNKNLNKIRIKVEHSILKCKRFKILKQIYRHSLKNYSKRFQIIAGLVNLKIQESIKQLELINSEVNFKQSTPVII